MAQEAQSLRDRFDLFTFLHADIRKVWVWAVAYSRVYEISDALMLGHMGDISQSA